MLVGEPSGDGGASQMDDRVDAGQQLRVGIRGVPTPFVGVACVAPDQPDDPVPAGAQKRRQRRTDQPRRSGDGDRRSLQTVLGGHPVGSQVVGQLAVPVVEHGPQQRSRHRGLDPVDHPGAVIADVYELVGVAPAQRHSRRKRGQAVTTEGVDEPARGIVAVRLMHGDPAQAAGQRQRRPPVLERGCLGDEAHRLPRRREAVEGTRPGMPIEDVRDRRVHHARIVQAHA